MQRARAAAAPRRRARGAWPGARTTCARAGRRIRAHRSSGGLRWGALRWVRAWARLGRLRRQQRRASAQEQARIESSQRNTRPLHGRGCRCRPRALGAPKRPCRGCARPALESGVKCWLNRASSAAVGARPNEYNTVAGSRWVAVSRGRAPRGGGGAAARRRARRCAQARARGLGASLLNDGCIGVGRSAGSRGAAPACVASHIHAGRSKVLGGKKPGE